MNNDDNGLREDDVCKTLGIGEKLVRQLRNEHLRENEHWTRDRSGRVYTREAVELLRRKLLGATEPLIAPLLAPEPEPKPPASAEPTEIEPVTLKPGQRIEDDRLVEDLTISKMWPERTGMVLGRRPNNDEVTVRLRTTENLMVGMTLRGCYRGEFHVWYYGGPKPKRRGKW